MKNKSIKQFICLLISLYFCCLLLGGLNVQAAKSFEDVNTTADHYEGINYLNQLNVYDYKLGNQFYPNESITRNEVAKIIHTLYKGQFEVIRDYNENPFLDVNSSNPYYESIVWSYEVGIFDGSEGFFKGEDNLTRAQFAKIFVKTFDLTYEGQLPLFNDVPKSHWASEYIYTLYGMGITTGSNGNFMPDHNVTNGQFASFLYRTIQKVNGNEVSNHVDLKQDVNNKQQASKNVLATYASEYDFVWNQIGINLNLELEGVNDNNEVVGFYSTIKGKELFGVTIGKSTEDDVISLYGEELDSIFKKGTVYKLLNDKGHAMYFIDGKYVTFFYDLFNHKIVRSILWIDEEYEINKEGFYGNEDVQKRQEGFENLMVELMNQARVAEGMNALNSAQQYRETARKHSQDMVKNSFFSHKGSDGRDSLKRMLDDGMDFISICGENLAAGAYNTIYAHEALMNSDGHRKNILYEEYTHAFTGVEFDGTRPYWTVNFYTTK